MDGYASRIKRSTRLVIVSLALAGAGVAAAADDHGWIAGLSVGQAKLQDFRLPTTSADDTGTVVSVFGGYQFTRYFSVAGGYVDLGDYSFQGTSFGGYDWSMKIRGVQVSAIGSYPVLERVDLQGSVGVYRWHYKFHSAADAFDPERNLSDNGYSPTLGIGVTIDIFSKRGSYLYLGWQRFFNVGNRNTVENENDFNLFLVGAVYNFSKLMEGKK